MRPSILITDALLVTVDPDRRVIESGWLAVDDDRIVGLGPMESCPHDGAGRVIDGTRFAVYPGLVNAHAHTSDVVLRGGISDDLGLYDWLLNVHKAVEPLLTAEDRELSTLLHCLESVRNGATTTVDLSETSFEIWPETAEAKLRAYERTGMRAIYAESYYDHSPPELGPFLQGVEARNPGLERHLFGAHPLDEQLKRIEELLHVHHGRADGRISYWPSPSVAVYSSRESLLGAKDLARRNHVGVTLHVAESPQDRLQCGVSSVEYLAGIGFLGPEVLAAHCVYTDSNDIRRLKAFDVKVAHNPVSNMFLGNGIAPIAEMVTAGITVGLGTDNTDLNSSVNLIADMRLAALGQKARYQDPTALTAEQVLEMATIGGARAIGLEHEIGSLEVGKKADLFLLDLRRSTMVPFRSPASGIVYQAQGSEVSTVLIDGRVVLDQGRVTWLEPDEEAELLTRAQSLFDRVVRDGDLRRYRSRWATPHEAYTGHHPPEDTAGRSG